jgi:hypothetical protein
MEISDFFSDRENTILEALRPLLEQRLEVTNEYGHRGLVNVFKGVSAQGLIQLLATSKMKQVRGISHGRDLYFWDSFYANHNEVAEALGIKYNPDERLHVWMNGEKTCIDFLDREMGDYPQSFAMKRLLTSPDLYFDGRTSGYIPGPEMLQLIAA